MRAERDALEVLLGLFWVAVRLVLERVTLDNSQGAVSADGGWAGWSLVGPKGPARGKSGLRRTGWSVTPTGRKARESATENRPPRLMPR